MKVSQVGIDLIKRFEGCKLTAYKATPSEQFYTIGYGHYGADVKSNQTITLKKAEDLLCRDIDRFEKLVNKYDHIYKWNQNEFDALTAFAYNIGSIDGLTSNGTRSRTDIINAWSKYNKAGGVVLAGLVKRRDSELKLFIQKVPESTSTRIVALKETQKIKTIIDKIMAGEFGNGEERKTVLYNSIQALVNKR